jgi:hypothetical protein
MLERAAFGRPFLCRRLVDQAAAEADSDRVRAAASLELREEVPDMALDRLLGEEEPDADLAVHEPVGDQLQHLDLPGGRLLLQLLKRRGLERNHLGDRRIATCGNRLEPSGVLAVSRKDLVALSSVHDWAIGPR